MGLENSNKPYTMLFVLSTLDIALLQGPYGPWLREQALAPRPFRPNFRGKVVFSKSHAFVRIELRGAIVELAPNIKNGLGLLALWELC